MFDKILRSGVKEEDEKLFLSLLEDYRAEGDDIFTLIGNLSNASALIGEYLSDITWVGFYLFDGEKLVLGPFQGEPACTPLNLERGVCAKAARERKTVNVKDVDTFPGHIACSSKSKSELVVPIVNNGNLLGVLDIDSPSLNRFSSEDETFMEKVAGVIATYFVVTL